LEFNNQLNSQLQVLSEAINQRFLDLERRISIFNEIQKHIYPKINNYQDKFQRMFLFDLRSDPSTWIAHFNNFYINWEISLQSCADGLGIRLRPFGFVGNQNLGVFNISLECIHPSSDKLRVAYKYNQIEMSPARYLEEQCFLSMTQSRFFVQDGRVMINIKMKRL